MLLHSDVEKRLLNLFLLRTAKSDGQPREFISCKHRGHFARYREVIFVVNGLKEAFIGQSDGTSLVHSLMEQSGQHILSPLVKTEHRAYRMTLIEKRLPPLLRQVNQLLEGVVDVTDMQARITGNQRIANGGQDVIIFVTLLHQLLLSLQTHLGRYAPMRLLAILTEKPRHQQAEHPQQHDGHQHKRSKVLLSRHIVNLTPFGSQPLVNMKVAQLLVVVTEEVGVIRYGEFARCSSTEYLCHPLTYRHHLTVRLQVIDGQHTMGQSSILTSEDRRFGVLANDREKGSPLGNDHHRMACIRRVADRINDTPRLRLTHIDRGERVVRVTLDKAPPHLAQLRITPTGHEPRFT